MQKMPYFLTNEEWYWVDDSDDERGYKLTDKAPKEAVDSYNDFYGVSVKLDEETQKAFEGYVFE